MHAAPRVAIVSAGYAASEEDPFVSAWRGALRAWQPAARLMIFALRYPAQVGTWVVDGVQVRAFGGADLRLRHSPALWGRAVAAIRAEHRRSPFDVVHALEAGEPGMVAALAARRIGRPLVVHIGGGELAALPALAYGAQNELAGRLFVRLALHGAARVTTGSHRMTLRARSHVGPTRASRVCWAPLPVPVDALGARVRAARTARTTRAAPCSQPRMLSVARLVPVKGHEVLLRAFARFAARHPAWGMDMVGGGPCLAELRTLARRLGIDGRLRWWGWLHHDAIHHAYARATAFAHGSYHEAQGLALIEAAACGLPVATTAMGVAEELPSPTRWLARPGDPEALAAAMEGAVAAARPGTGEGSDAWCEPLRRAWGPAACRQRQAAIWRELTPRSPRLPAR